MTFSVNRSNEMVSDGNLMKRNQLRSESTFEAAAGYCTQKRPKSLSAVERHLNHFGTRSAFSSRIRLQIRMREVAIQLCSHIFQLLSKQSYEIRVNMTGSSYKTEKIHANTIDFI